MLRPRIETAISLLFAALAVLTLIRPSWIETLTMFEPDGGNGALEWLIVFVFGVIAIGLGLRARSDYRLARHARELAADHGGTP